MNLVMMVILIKASTLSIRHCRFDNDDFAGGGGQRDVGCGRGGRSLCQDEASSWGDISSIFSAMDSENIFD